MLLHARKRLLQRDQNTGEKKSKFLSTVELYSKAVYTPTFLTFKRKCVCWLICNKGFHSRILCSQVNHPVKTPEQASLSPKSCTCSWTKEKKKIKCQESPPCLQSFFSITKYSSSRKAVFSPCSIISHGPMLVLTPALSRRTRDVLGSLPVPGPLQVPEPLQSSNTQQTSWCGIHILLHVTRISGTRGGLHHWCLNHVSDLREMSDMGLIRAIPTLNLIWLQSSLNTAEYPACAGCQQVWVLGLYQSETMTFPFIC